MALVVTLIVVSAAVFAVCWGLGLFLQKYLYNQPADKLVLRAAVGGLLVGCYLTFWVYVNTRADRENKYGAIHQFSPGEGVEVKKFEAVQKRANGTESNLKFERQSGGKGFRYVSANADRKAFEVNSPDFLTVAILVPEEGKESIRFDAVMKDGKTYEGDKYIFKEVGGSRTIELGKPFEPGEAVSVVSPSAGIVFLAIALNLIHFAVWLAVFWPTLRFGLGHAIGLAAIFTVALTIILVPLLFDLNRVKPVPVEVKKA